MAPIYNPEHHYGPSDIYNYTSSIEYQFQVRVRSLFVDLPDSSGAEHAYLVVYACDNSYGYSKHAVAGVLSPVDYKDLMLYFREQYMLLDWLATVLEGSEQTVPLQTSLQL